MPIFQWNNYAKRSFEDATGVLSSDNWVIKMIHGSFEQIKICLYTSTLSVSLIGRRLV